MEKGKLYLIPVPLGEDSLFTIPNYVIEILHTLDIFIVERIRTTRRFISSTKPTKKIDDLTFFELDKRNPKNGIQVFIKPIFSGKNIGVLSEAGCPGIADPGAFIVEYAHQHDIEVIPLIGPSSILLALISSGLNGQNFAFNGYLPVKTPERIKALKQLEKLVLKNNQTQIFMETPYRNMALIKDVLQTISPSIKFCMASDLTTKEQYIKTQSIKDWKNQTVENLHKRPTVFLIGT